MMPYNTSLLSRYSSQIRDLLAGSQAQSAPQPQEQTNRAMQYIAPPQYQSFASLFGQQQPTQNVTNVYDRAALPNQLLARYNSLADNLQAQQAAMVPRQQTATQSMGQPVFRVPQQNPYINFAQMFAGNRNG